MSNIRVNTSVYDQKFFEKYSHHTYVKDHKALAKGIKVICSPSFVIDVGCGSGQVLYWLTKQYSVDILGFEGSPQACTVWQDEIKNKIKIANCAEPLAYTGVRADVVISLEVAEHLPGIAAGTFIENIAKLTNKYVVFSAAPPGQTGKDHINLQPWSYWAEKFKVCQFTVDDAKTAEFSEFLKSRLVHQYYRSNLRVLKKNES